MHLHRFQFKRRNPAGFTIVELLIVIVIIAILAAITIVAYSGIQSRSRDTKINSDLALLKKAIIAGRINVDSNMQSFVTNGYVAGSCTSKPAGTDLATLPKTDACWTQYNTALQQIQTASGVTVTGMVDPWGRPYLIDSNEGEIAYNGGCANDVIAAFSYPFNGTSRTNSVSIPLYSTSC